MVFSTLGDHGVRKAPIAIEEEGDTPQKIEEINNRFAPAPTGSYGHQPLFNSASVEFGLEKFFHYFKVREASYQKYVTTHKPSYFFHRTGPPPLPA